MNKEGRSQLGKKVVYRTKTCG